MYDFAQQGFPLIEGRLDDLNQRPVAAMADRHRQHVLNLLVWQDKAQCDAARAASRQGYQLLHWTQASMCRCAIAVMNAQDLSGFKRSLTLQIEKDGQREVVDTLIRVNLTLLPMSSDVLPDLNDGASKGV